MCVLWYCWWWHARPQQNGPTLFLLPPHTHSSLETHTDTPTRKTRKITTHTPTCVYLYDVCACVGKTLCVCVCVWRGSLPSRVCVCVCVCIGVDNVRAAVLNKNSNFQQWRPTLRHEHQPTHNRKTYDDDDDEHDETATAARRATEKIKRSILVLTDGSQLNGHQRQRRRRETLGARTRSAACR